jgi:hypothetical protein
MTYLIYFMLMVVGGATGGFISAYLRHRNGANARQRHSR